LDFHYYVFYCNYNILHAIQLYRLSGTARAKVIDMETAKPETAVEYKESNNNTYKLIKIIKCT
jgi:hypothetical protein